MAIIHSVTLVGWSTLWLACGLIIIAAVDVPVQLWEAHKKLLMTKQEVRDEHRIRRVARRSNSASARPSARCPSGA